MNDLTTVLDKKKWHDWQDELADLVIEADRTGMLLRSKYQGIIFTPRGLANQLIKGKFRWGVINWELIQPREGLEISFPDPK